MTDVLNLFKGKSVFVTGHTGFKGSWLSYWLTLLGANVTGYALAPEYEGCLFDRLDMPSRMNHILGDVRDGEKLKAAVNKAQPEFVFHLAAQALVRRSYNDPITTFDTNVMGSAHLLEAIRACETVRSLVYITSDKCYLNKEWVWGYRETDELGGPDPYSASKAAAELVFRSYFQSYFKNRKGLGCGSARAGNVIGGGDRSLDRIVPDIIRAAEQGQPVILRSPQATRPWQHVMDPVYGYMTLGAHLYHNPGQYNGEGWNFGPPSSSIRTVKDLTDRLVKHWPGVGVVIDPPKDAPHEATLLHLSIEKAQSYLGWYPRYHFDQAVDATGSWYKRIQSGEDAVQVTSQQIQEFTGFLK